MTYKTAWLIEEDEINQPFLIFDLILQYENVTYQKEGFWKLNHKCYLYYSKERI